MKNPFIRLFRARDKPGVTDSVSSAPTFYFGSSAAGKSVTASTAIQMSTVYACVRVIAETIASLPLHVYQNQGEGSVKALEHPLCAECLKNGVLTPATVVDHIVPHRGDHALFWDEQNWQPLCKDCHDRKTGQEM